MFPFIYVCDLLEALQQIQCRHPPYLPKDAEARKCEAIKTWFCTHRSKIDCEADGESLISTLLPSRRTDRVYGMRERRLQKIVARALGLSRHRMVDLERWRTPGAGDLADCVERVQRQREIALPRTASQVSVEEIDGVLLEISSRCRFSSPEIRLQARKNTTSNPDEMLGGLFQRLQATQSKWLIRLMLKEYAPVSLPEFLVHHCYNDLLPQVLNVHNHLATAISLLKRLAAESNVSLSRSSRLEILRNLQPQVGTKIGRPPFFKGRSIKHCVVMSRGRCMSVERKMDGEYMQIHIDMSKPPSGQIKIFSKTGKDSTDDRKNVHSAIRKCLRLGDAECMVQKQCILEGELLVYSDRDQKVLDFYKIRKHVNRSGVFLGIEKDSQPHTYEHLMVVFFDLLVLDERIGLNHKQRDRRQEMEKLIQCTKGSAELVQREVISFSGTSAASDLRRAFARVITTGGEGLILKPTDEPYFSFEGKGDYSSCCIKMKKEYIGNYGSVGDFAVVAASYDPVKAKQLGVQGVQWTDFYIGCLENKDDIIRLAAEPKFVLVTTVSPNAQIVRSLHSDINPGASDYGSDKNFEIRLEKGIAQGRAPTTFFKNPPIFDMRCFGFEKEGCTGFFTMRFPQVSKLHYDRTFMDAVTFLELQEMAETATSLPVDGDEQEDVRWIEKLKAADPRGIAIDAETQETLSPNAKPKKLNSAGLTTSQYHRSSHPPETSPRPTKRSRLPAVTDQNSSPKRLCRSPKTTLMRSPGSSSAIVSTKSPLKMRGPLSDITNTSKPVKEGPRGCFVDYSLFEKPSSCPVNIQRQSNQQPPYPTLPDETSPARLSKSFPSLSSNTGISKPLWDLPMAVWSDDLQQSPLSPRSAITGKCGIMAEKPCPLMRATICLSPCVSAMPLLTEDLLPAHGVRFTCDIRSWLDRSKFPGRCIATKKVIRKILLVEPKRKQPTIDFLHEVESMNVGNRDGKKEWVEVYDWRLLESIHDFERGKTVAFDIWKHHWIAAVSLELCKDT